MKLRYKLLSSLSVVAAIALLIFGVMTFVPKATPAQEQAAHQAFITKLSQSFSPTNNVPAGRVVVFDSGRGFPTVRVVMINDYGYDKTDGSCLYYKYLFSDTQQKDCVPAISRDQIADTEENIQ